MKVYVNKKQTVTIQEDGGLVYEVCTQSLKESFDIVECWLRIYNRGDGGQLGTRAFRALANAQYRVASVEEWKWQDDPRIHQFNENVNPSGRAGSSQWEIGR